MEFLGFQIWQSGGLIPSAKKYVNSIEEHNQTKMDSKSKVATVKVPRLRITFSMSEVLHKLVGKGLARFKKGKFFPTSYKSALRYDAGDIVNYLKTVFRGLANYFGYSQNWYNAKSLYNYFGKFTIAMTLAHKTKSKLPKIFKKYGKDLVITNQVNRVIAKYGSLSSKEFREGVSKLDYHLSPNIEALLSENLRLAKQRLIK